ncbi:MAG TPA: hypothetical protein VIO94_02970 [Phenylobacterium sp.]
MEVFLDFEASSLSDDSYPIEVGWVFADGRTETHLIRPARLWTDWDADAERIHGITRERLLAEGELHDAVAERMMQALAGHDIYVTAPSWDGKWLSVLLRAAGLPRHGLRVKDSDLALSAAARQALGPGAGKRALEARIAEARDRLSEEPVEHRALADAQQERRLWLEIRTPDHPR